MDLRLRSNLVKGLDLDTALCWFNPSADWKPGGDASFYFYLTLTAHF